MASSSALVLAEDLARIADGKKAEAIRILDVSAQHSEIDCFVIATARSSKHATVVGEEAAQFLKRERNVKGHLEKASNWICGDFGEVVLHVFTSEAREYYDLEALWGDAKRVAWTPAPTTGSVPA